MRHELGELAQAFTYLMKLRELDPEDHDAQLKLGDVYLLARQPAKAREQRSSGKIRRTSRRCCCGPARPVRRKSGIYQRAIAPLKESAAKLPDNPEVQYHLLGWPLKSLTAAASTNFLARTRHDGP